MKVEFVVPAYNEEKILEDTVSKLVDYFRENVSDDWRITVADNASTDGTLDIAKALSEKYENVGYVHLDEKGRGRALKKAWTLSDADIVGYMDADLATDLRHVNDVISAIKAGADIVTGSRLIAGSNVERGLPREILSRGYNLLVKLILGVKFNDAQCGFKALRRDVFAELAPLTKHDEWFFDTELITIGEKMGYVVGEVPVEWHDDPDSKVDVISTTLNYLRSIVELRLRLRKINLGA